MSEPLVTSQHRCSLMMFIVEKKHLLKVFFFFLKSHVDERMMMSQYVFRQVYTHNLNNDKVGEGWGYS